MANYQETEHTEYEGIGCTGANTGKSRFCAPVGVSARHVHLSAEHVDALFGKGYILRQKKQLMGGQYAAEEQVTVVGTGLRAIESVRVLGPERKATQIEVSKTDAVKLGINPPVRESGDIKGSSPVILVGPMGAVCLDEGCIIAKRHIHMPPELAAQHGIKDGDDVTVTFSGERGGELPNATARVDKSYTLETHIDTDEANALGVKTGDICEVYTCRR